MSGIETMTLRLFRRKYLLLARWLESGRALIWKLAFPDVKEVWVIDLLKSCRVAFLEAFL